MTLSKGNRLFKVTPYEPDPRAGSIADRIRGWADLHALDEISDRELAQILCPNESYVIHEVAEDVHYESGRFFDKEAASPVSHVDARLKVIY